MDARRRLPVFSLPRVEESEEKVREFWEAFDEASDAFPQMRSNSFKWQPRLWQSRSFASHRSLIFDPCGEDDPGMVIVVELCVDSDAEIFYPLLTLRSRAVVPSMRPDSTLEPTCMDLRCIAAAAVTVFRRFRKYGFVGGSCHDFIFELGSELTLNPLILLQPEADRITEEVGEYTRPTSVRLSTIILGRVAATATGCTPAIAVMDFVATTGVLGQLCRKAYQSIRNDYVPVESCGKSGEANRSHHPGSCSQDSAGIMTTHKEADCWTPHEPADSIDSWRCEVTNQSPLSPSRARCSGGQHRHRRYRVPT